MSPHMSRIKFMNTEIDNLTMTEALSAIEDLIQQKKNAYVVTPNVDHIVKLESNELLKASYAEADLILTDGKPLIWASQLYHTPIKEKISGSDLFPELCKLAAQKHYSMFFLGAREGIAATAAEKLNEQLPNLNIVGCYAPPLGFENDPNELKKIEKNIKEANPQILILALGCPKQEILAYQLRKQFNVPITLCLGATLDFAAGYIKRAPCWMRNAGLEWLYRLYREPIRMFKRYILEDWKFIGLFFKYFGNAV